MIMIDDYIEAGKILSYPEALIRTKKEYAYLKQYSQIEREKIEKEIDLQIGSNFFNKDIIENRIDFSKYPNTSKLNKEIILANIILPDDVKIIDILTEAGFTLEHLKTIVRFRSILKNLLINNSIITDELKEQIAIYKRVTTKLINVFKEHFNFNESTIILNRITEMLITCPNLFETKINTNKLVK